MLITDDDPDYHAAPVGAELRIRGVTLGIIGHPNYPTQYDGYNQTAQNRKRFHSIGFPADLSVYFSGENDVHLLNELFDNIMA